MTPFVLEAEVRFTFFSPFVILAFLGNSAHVSYAQESLVAPGSETAASASGISASSSSGPAAENPEGVMVREVEYIAPSAAATPCPTVASGGRTEGCVDPDPREAFKNFKMNVPVDWDVHFNEGSYALYMEPKNKAVATAENPVAADANIGVKVTKNPIPIDDKGLEEFAEEIEQGLNRNEQGTENKDERIYKVFAKTFVNLPFGHRAYLYYVSGKINDISVRQAILVASTQNVRYRVQLTDHEVNFDKNLGKYFPIMTSLQLSGVPLERSSGFMAILPWLLTFFGIVAIFVVLRIVQLRGTRRLIREAEMESGPASGAGSVPATGANNSVVGSNASNTDYPMDDD